jgi:2-amino-4-hydroxy-6-hydroxymethyldihydropteridine diphosphokinase
MPMTAMVLIGLGSNLRHASHGAPADVLRAAVAQLAARGLTIMSCSRLIQSAPMGPKQPRFTNGVILAQSPLAPLALLDLLKSIEQAFGRRAGRRWGPRVLDLDLLAYDQLQLRTARLTLPHPGLALRPFVLWPACEVAPDWRFARQARTVRQLAVRAGGRKSVRPAGFL